MEKISIYNYDDFNEADFNERCDHAEEQITKLKSEANEMVESITNLTEDDPVTRSIFLEPVKQGLAGLDNLVASARNILDEEDDDLWKVKRRLKIIFQRFDDQILQVPFLIGITKRDLLNWNLSGHVEDS